MRFIHSAAVSISLIVLAMSLGCGSDEGKKDSASGAAGSAASAKAAAVAGASSAIDTSYLLPEHFFALVVQPRRIAESPLVAAQLKDAKVADEIKKFGIEPVEVEQLIIATSMVEFTPKHPEPMPTAIAHFNHDIDLKDIATKLMKAFESRNPMGVKETEISGKKCYALGSGDAVAYAPDARTIVMSNPIVLKKIIAGAAAKAPLAERLAKAGDNDAVLVFLPGNSPDFLEQLDIQVRHAEPIVQSFAAALKGVESAEASFNVNKESLLRIVVDAKDAAAAGAVHDLLKDLVKMAGAGVAFLKQSMPPDVKPVFTPVLQLADEALDSAEITKSGNQVTAAIKRPADLDEVLGPQFEQVKKIMRGKAEAAQRMNNLKEIALACFNYESTFRTFPPAAISKDGKPLLSWRVAILPFIEEDSLYKQFKLDEPWDSPNNIKLLDKMPEVYRTAGRANDGKTSIMVFAGKDTVFDGAKALSPQDIHDGASHTILAVEAGPDKAVPWTKPEDLPFDPKNPAAALGDVPSAGFAAAFCDGSVRILPKTIDAETLKGLITPNGSELVDPEKLNGGK